MQISIPRHPSSPLDRYQPEEVPYPDFNNGLSFDVIKQVTMSVPASRFEALVAGPQPLPVRHMHDAFAVHAPLHGSRFEEVALNPQPLPPVEAKQRRAIGASVPPAVSLPGLLARFAGVLFGR